MKIRVNLHMFRRPLYWGLLLLFLKSSVSYSAVVPYSDLADNIISMSGLALLVAEILMKHYSWRRLGVYAIVGVLSLINVSRTGHFVIFWTVIICMAICDEDIDKIAVFMYKFERVFLILHTVFAICMSLFAGYPLFSNIYGVYRLNLGFAHPNLLSVSLFCAIILWAWLNFDRITYNHILGIACISLVSYVLTKTRTALLVQFVFLFMLVCYKTRIQSTKLLTWSAAVSVPIMGGVFLLLVGGYFSGNRLSYIADELLSGRIRLGAYAYELYGLTLFGENFNNLSIVWDAFWGLSGSHTFDCAYTYLFSNQGLIWFLVIVIAFVNLAKRNNVKINIMLIVWSLYGSTEVHVLDGAKFFPVLLISLLIGSENNRANGKYLESKGNEMKIAFEQKRMPE